MNVRRVVTGHDQDGKAVVVSDELVEATEPDFGQKWHVWGADGPVVLPDGGEHPPFAGPLLPSPSGFNVMTFTLPPSFNPDEITVAPDHPALDREAHPLVDDPNPRGTYGSVPGAAGMHATPSVDCLLQVSGENVLVLEDAEVRLRPGDWVVVNGVMHSWRNDLPEPSVMAGFVYGATHRGAPLRHRAAV